MGDGVNIAARLGGHRRAGRDLPVRARLPAGEGRLDIAVTDLGPTQLKNIESRCWSTRCKSARRR